MIRTRLTSLLAALALLLALRAPGADETPSCARLLRHLAVTRNAFSAEDLRAFAEAPVGSDPMLFASGLGPIERLVFGKAFGRMAGDGKAGHRAAREEALRLFGERGRAEARRESAKGETQALPAPVRLETLAVGSAVHRAMGTVLEIDRKPFGVYALGDHRLAVVDLERRKLARKIDAGGPLMSYRPIPFTHSGDPYLAYSAPGLRFLNLRTFRHDRKLLPPEELLAKGAVHSAVAIGDRIAAIDAASRVVLFAPGSGSVVRGAEVRLFNRGLIVADPEGRPELFADARGSMSTLVRLDRVTGNATRFPLPARVHWRGFYRRGESLRAVLATREGVLVLDVTTGKSATVSGTAGQSTGWLTVFESGGRQYATASRSEPARRPQAFFLMDLARRRVVNGIPARDATTPMIPFRVGEETLLVYGDARGQVHVLDPFKTEGSVSAGVSSGAIGDIVPYATGEGEIHALVIPDKRPGVIIQLFGRRIGADR